MVDCAFALVFSSSVRSQPQVETTALQKVQALNNPTLKGKIPVYYSPGYEKRAKELQPILEEACRYFDRKLKTKVDVSLAVLTKEQWKQVRGQPYGLPNVSSAPHVVFLPATDDGVIAADALSSKGLLTAAATEKLRSTGYTFDQAAVKVVDLIALHELGHTYAVSLGMGPPRPTKWFSEFIASYIAYAYLREKHPKLATLFYVMAADLALDVPRPKHTSLADFELLYASVGPRNYGWYQGRFFQRIAQVYDAKGIAFVNDAMNAFPASEGESLALGVVLERLEKITPGFMEWSKDLR
jgi:hypothetical protein